MGFLQKSCKKKFQSFYLQKQILPYFIVYKILEILAYLCQLGDTYVYTAVVIYSYLEVMS